jgi:hypothetical protein
MLKLTELPKLQDDQTGLASPHHLVSSQSAAPHAEASDGATTGATYPNIVPANNLRLPDALTIKHGPAPLLARFVLEADKAVRDMGLLLRLRTDFGELVYANEHYAKSGAWYPLVDAFNPHHTELTAENAFWVSGENDRGEIVVTWAARIYNWIGTNLAEQARTVWYGQDLGQPCVVTAEAAKRISGVIVFAGASWVRPDFRGKHCSHLFPRIGKAYACSRWPIDWAIGYIGRANVEKGLAASYGQQNLSYSVFYPGSPRGEQVVVYTPVDQVYADLAKFLATKLSGAARTDTAAGLRPNVREHIVTNISSDGVLHGNISRS